MLTSTGFAINRLVQNQTRLFEKMTRVGYAKL